MSKHHFATNALHRGHEPAKTGYITPPVGQSVSYPLETVEYAEKLFRGEIEGHTYVRIDNPTVKILEDRVASLEGAEAALGTSSGMAAIFLTTLHFAGAGDEIVTSNKVYGGTHQLNHETYPHMGITVREVVDPENLDSWRAMISERTKLLYVETPSNPFLYVADLEGLAAIAHEAGVPLVVDATIGTPALVQPIELGADIVIHSATKYMCGNATALGGIVAGKKEFIDELRGGVHRNIGASMSPMNAWLILQGLETLPLRMEKHCRNAMEVASFLVNHPRVKAVNYPGLSSHPQHEIAKKQMAGASSLLSFDLSGTIENARRFVNALELFTHTTHLGATISLATHPASTTHEQLGPEGRAAAGVSDTMIRISVGLEDPRDIVGDLAQALETAYGGPATRRDTSGRDGSRLART